MYCGRTPFLLQEGLHKFTGSICLFSKRIYNLQNQCMSWLSSPNEKTSFKSANTLAGYCVMSDKGSLTRIIRTVITQITEGHKQVVY